MAPERQPENEYAAACFRAAIDHEIALRAYYAQPWWKRLLTRRPQRQVDGSGGEQ